MASRARNRNSAGFERFAQRFQHFPAELGKLVQKEHAVVRERYFAGARVAASAHQRNAGCGVVRRPERALLPSFQAKPA